MITIPTQPCKITEVVKFGVILWVKTFKELVPFILLLTFFIVSFLCLQPFEIDLDQVNKLSPANQSSVAPPVTNLESIDLSTSLTLVGSVLTLVIGGIILTAAMIYHMDAIAHQKSPSILQSLTVGCRKSIPYVIVGFLYGICVLLGFILLVIPGIYFMMLLLFAPYLVVIKDVGIAASFRESWTLVSKNWWRSFGTFILATLMSTIFTFVLFTTFGLVIGLLAGLLEGLFSLNMEHFGWVGDILFLIIIIFIYITVNFVLNFSMILSLLYDLEIRQQQQKISALQ